MSLLKKTKIIFTIGPATSKDDVLQAVFEAGANICRVNAAHAGPDEIVKAIQQVTAMNKKLGTFVATLVDIKGPEIRTGEIHILENSVFASREKIDLTAEGRIYLVVAPDQSLDPAFPQVNINYAGLLEDVVPGQTLLLDNGLLSLKVESIGETYLLAKVVVGGVLGQRRHVNLPGVYVRLPSITDKDKIDAKVAVEAGVDFIALSFVRCAQDVMNLRAYLREINSEAKIIAKIEDESGVRHVEEIIKAADGIMVARGDLGVETPIEYIPLEQSKMAHLSHTFGKPVVIATHMLESMISTPVPTRAEVSDIAHAVGTDQADAIMLSGETGIGLYPVACVEMMASVARAQENCLPMGARAEFPLKGAKERLIGAAVDLAQAMGGASIVVFTRDGFSAKVLATLRPAHCRLFACTDCPIVAREMSLYWGIEPILLALGEHQMSEEFAVNEAVLQLQRLRLIVKGEELVVLAKTSVSQSSVISGDTIDHMVDSLQIRKVS